MTFKPYSKGIEVSAYSCIVNVFLTQKIGNEKCFRCTRDLFCLTDNLNIQQIQEAMNELNIEGTCNCLPSCTSIQYDAETSQATFDYKALFGAFKENATDPDVFG